MFIKQNEKNLNDFKLQIVSTQIYKLDCKKSPAKSGASAPRCLVLGDLNTFFEFELSLLQYTVQASLLFLLLQCKL